MIYYLLIFFVLISLIIENLGLIPLINFIKLIIIGYQSLFKIGLIRQVNFFYRFLVMLSFNFLSHFN